MELAHRIRWARENAKGGKLSQPELARRAGFVPADKAAEDPKAGQSRIAMYESDSKTKRNKREATIADLSAIASATGVSLAWLLSGQGAAFAGDPGITADNAVESIHELRTAITALALAVSEIGPTASQRICDHLVSLSNNGNLSPWNARLAELLRTHRR